MNAKSNCLNPPVIDLGSQIVAESSPNAVPILDLLINTKRFCLVAGQKRSIPAFFTRSEPTPRQFLAESSVCVFFTRILTSAQMLCSAPVRSFGAVDRKQFYVTM